MSDKISVPDKDRAVSTRTPDSLSGAAPVRQNDRTGSNVPVDAIDDRLMGRGLQTSEGRGVKNGIPYGQQLQTEKNEVESRYRFMPGAAGRLRAATRKALGRG